MEKEKEEKKWSERLKLWTPIMIGIVSLFLFGSLFYCNVPRIAKNIYENEFTSDSLQKCPCCKTGQIQNNSRKVKASDEPNVYSQTGTIGDTFGGTIGPLVGLLAAIITGLAFWVQYEANRIQNKVNVKQDEESQLLQFEDKFFELLKLHRDNVSDLSYSKFHISKIQTSENRKVFKEIFSEFIDCYREVVKFSNSVDVNYYITTEYQIKLKNITARINPKINLIQMAHIDIAYSIVFYGIGFEGETILREKLKKRYNNHYLFRLFTYLKLKPKKENEDAFKEWEKVRIEELTILHPLIEELYKHRSYLKTPVGLKGRAKTLFPNYSLEKYYGGHQHRLGHYFRHLFQCYKFLNGIKFLDDKEKYFYGKTLRAQLSTYEQALIFVNGISSIGWKWEFTPDNIDEVTNEAKDKDDCMLITKYHLIKNFPNKHIYGIKLKMYFPNVKYEMDENI